MTFTTQMLAPETWDDFAALVEASNGVWGGCWCMGFHPEGVGAGHTREGNREAKRRHVTDGTVRQVLVYDGDRCVGWCQFGSPPELPNINNRGAYDRGADDPPDWRIGCIFTNAKDRGKSVAAAAVAAALDGFASPRTRHDRPWSAPDPNVPVEDLAGVIGPPQATSPRRHLVRVVQRLSAAT